VPSHPIAAYWRGLLLSMKQHWVKGSYSARAACRGRGGGPACRSSPASRHEVQARRTTVIMHLAIDHTITMAADRGIKTSIVPSPAPTRLSSRSRPTSWCAQDRHGEVCHKKLAQFCPGIALRLQRSLIRQLAPTHGRAPREDADPAVRCLEAIGRAPEGRPHHGDYTVERPPVSEHGVGAGAARPSAPRRSGRFR
jgi:hypothetical protein